MRPLVTVKLGTPVIQQTDNHLVVPVYFKSSLPKQKLFGINFRMFLDSFQMTYIGKTGINSFYKDGTTYLTWSNPAYTSRLGFYGQPKYLNTSIQCVDPLLAPTMDEWVPLFNLEFEINPAVQEGFYPSLVLDYNTERRCSFTGYNSGIVITVVLGTGSASADEDVDHLNWKQAVPTTQYIWGYVEQEEMVEF